MLDVGCLNRAMDKIPDLASNILKWYRCLCSSIQSHTKHAAKTQHK